MILGDMVAQPLKAQVATLPDKELSTLLKTAARWPSASKHC
jgi:hypothetical protein